MMYHPISQLLPGEHQRLMEVWEASVRATHHFVKEEKIQLLKSLIEEHKYFEQPDIFCIRNNAGDITGFAGVSGNSLDMLFLHPSVIGIGVGGALMRHAIDHYKVTKVEVNEQNQQALGFYQHFGFSITGYSETDSNGEPFPLLYLERQPLEINRIGISGLDELISICQRSYYETFFEAFGDAEAYQSFTRELFNRARLLAELSNPAVIFYLASYNGQTAGYLKLCLDEMKTEIDSIYVLGTYQKLGIGKALIAHALGVAKNRASTELILRVWDQNQQAICFYERQGFVRSGEIRYQVMGDPQVDILMRLAIL